MSSELIGIPELERFRGSIAGRLGLHFDDAKFGFLADVLRRRLEVTDQESQTYLSRLEKGSAQEELRALARALTVPETYFFRNIDQLKALTERVIPERVAARQLERQIRLLSLGCASGEEAYTLAMVVRAALPAADWAVSILGVDVNDTMLEKARRGRFSAWALRETPDDAKERWFRRDGRDFVLQPAVLEAVRFEERNLVDDDPGLWRSGSYDVVFCRNVIMYFSPDQACLVVSRILGVLASAGYLFLGHAETLRGLSNEFHLRHTHDTFYYQRKDHQDHRMTSSVASQPTDPRHLPDTSLAALEDGASWVDAIRRASARVEALTDQRPAHRPASGVGSPRGTRGWDLGFVLELVRKERFAEALAMIDGLPSESGGDSDVLLLRAVLLTHTGQLVLAETACKRLLEVDDLSTGAHYLLALCREGAGDPSGASYHDQVAAYLDPGFAMPRLHLGLLARRAGDVEAARRELGQALILLQREDASRVILFGGGFGREALSELCRAELVRSGGKA
jgi:chemotaxis protein methyltransferase CheR